MPSILTALPGVCIWVAVYAAIWADYGLNPIEYILTALR